MALSAGGIGSGLDVNNIVSQLMTLERRPLDALEEHERELESELSAFGQIKSALSSFQSAMSGLSSSSKFKVFSATSSDESVFTATSGTSAVAANYNVRVDLLAQNHKLAAAAFADTDTTTAGTGTLTLSVGGNSFDVTVDGTNNTLAGLRDAINNDENNTGISASIVTDVTGNRLVFTSNDSGAANNIVITAADGDGNHTDNAGISQFVYGAGTDNLTQTQIAQDATILVDGLTVKSASNTVTGAIQGVTLNLKKVTNPAVETLTIARDDDKIKENVQEFISAYNSLKSTISKYGGKEAELQGDSGLLSIERQIASVLNTPASGLDYSYLSELGITTQEGGDLALDSSELEEALNSNFDGVANFFADGTEGFAFRLDAVATSLLETDGLIDGREESINSRIKSVQDRQDNFEFRLELIEQRYFKQFSALDSLIVELNSTSDYLSQQLKNLPGARSA